MSEKRINIRFTPAQLHKLDRLAEKLGLDRSNTIRFCLARVMEIEGIADPKRR